MAQFHGEPGELIKGRVRSSTRELAIVDLEGGVEGFVQLDDLSWSKSRDVRIACTVGESRCFKVLTVATDGASVILCPHEKPHPAWEKAEDLFPVGSEHVGEVVNVMSYGIYVALQPGIEGCALDEKSPRPEIGSKVKVVVQNVDVEQRQIDLGMLEPLS